MCGGFLKAKQKPHPNACGPWSEADGRGSGMLCTGHTDALAAVLIPPTPGLSGVAEGEGCQAWGCHVLAPVPTESVVRPALSKCPFSVPMRGWH